MNGRDVEVAQSPQPEGWALSMLAEMLKVGPPLLSEIVECLQGIESIEAFVDLVRMLLPEREAEIMSAPRNKRVYKFCFYFGKKYYPLPANTDCPPSEWTDGMPVELMGMSYSAYHNLAMRPGYLMLLALVVYPYEGDERDEEDDSVPFNPLYSTTGKYKPSARDVAWLKDLLESLSKGGEWIAPMGFRITKISETEIELKQAVDSDNVRETIARTLLIAEKLGITAKFKTTGRTAKEKLSAARIPILDLVQRSVGEEIVRRIPAAGWHPEDLHKMTDNTKYDGVGHFADWACSMTGCILLDTSYENCNWVEGEGAPIFKWTKYNVDILTQQWPKVQEIRGKIDHLVEWLETDPQSHFPELVNFLLIHPHKPDKVKLHQYDHEEHWCDLEQESGEEEEDDNNR